MKNTDGLEHFINLTLTSGKLITKSEFIDKIEEYMEKYHDDFITVNVPMYVEALIDLGQCYVRGNYIFKSEL